MADTHPDSLDYVMRGVAFNKSDGKWKPAITGLGYWFVIEWLNVHGKLNISIPNKDYYISKYSTRDTDEYLSVK